MTELTLQTRIRDAELSVRTANLLCKAYGEDATFSDINAHDLDDLRRRLGAKGFREMQEVCFVLALDHVRQPDVRERKTLRDEFAMVALTGILAGLGHFSDFTRTTEAAYKMADAMMEARSK